MTDPSTAAASPAPVLETRRLVLSGPALADIDESMALWTDPRVTRHISGQPSTPEEVWMRLYRRAGYWLLRGFGSWTVRERATGRFIGEVGFADAYREIEPPINDIPELGWVLSPGARGVGFATEAACAALDWIDARHRPPRTICLIAPENLKSIRVAERCGYREFAQVMYKRQPTILFERHLPEP